MLDKILSNTGKYTMAHCKISLFRRRNESLREYTQRELAKEIRKESKGRIPADVREHLAKRTVDRMDFSNSYQMHKSLRGYAEILVQNYFAKRI